MMGIERALDQPMPIRTELCPIPVAARLSTMRTASSWRRCEASSAMRWRVFPRVIVRGSSPSPARSRADAGDARLYLK
jgi:hypothetical protein